MYKVTSIVIIILVIFAEASLGYTSDSPVNTNRRSKLLSANTTVSISNDTNGATNLKLIRLQPLYQFSKEDLSYTQINTKVGEGEGLFNMQLGYRRKIYKRGLLGLKIFYDLLEKSQFNLRRIDFHRGSTSVHRWGTGIEALYKQYEVRANAYLASTNSFAFKNIHINNRVSEGFDVEAGSSFLQCKERCKIFATYQWFNKLQGKDYQAIGVNMNVALYSGIKMTVAYHKELSSDIRGLSNNNIFVTFTANIDRLSGIIRPKRYKREREGGRELLTQSFARLNPFKIEGSVTRDNQ